MIIFRAWTMHLWCTFVIFLIFPDCGYKLVRYLPDSSVTSSSVHKSYETHHGKLDKNPDGWVPDGRDSHPYLQFDLGKLFLICGFEVKGCELNNKGRKYPLYVTRYRVQVSPEIDFWDSWNYIKVSWLSITNDLLFHHIYWTPRTDWQLLWIQTVYFIHAAAHTDIDCYNLTHIKTTYLYLAHRNQEGHINYKNHTCLYGVGGSAK